MNSDFFRFAIEIEGVSLGPQIQEAKKNNWTNYKAIQLHFYLIRKVLLC